MNTEVLRTYVRRRRWRRRKLENFQKRISYVWFSDDSASRTASSLTPPRLAFRNDLQEMRDGLQTVLGQKSESSPAVARVTTMPDNCVRGNVSYRAWPNLDCNAERESPGAPVGKAIGRLSDDGSQSDCRAPDLRGYARSVFHVECTA